MISEKGSIEGNGAVRLLLSVHQLKHTGILYMKREDVLKVLYFNRGRLLWAISNAGEDQLETVLIRHGVVKAEGLKAVKEGQPVNESIGKRLVEMNILSLEDLVRYTRIQLQQIVFSVLGWQQGGYQFVKDSPPQRLLSLDLDLTELVAAFILKRIDMSRIWDEIGSFQSVFVPCEDRERLEATGLTESQERLLRAFDGVRDLQAVVSRYASEHQESLLKVVFYLICAGLLSTRQAEVASVRETEEESFDTVGLLFSEEKEEVKEIHIPDPSLEEPETAEETEETDELTDTVFPDADRSRRRLGNWIYLLVLGILIVGGTVLILITRGGEAQLSKPPEAAAVREKKPEPGQPKIIEMKPAVRKDTADVPIEPATEDRKIVVSDNTGTSPQIEKKEPDRLEPRKADAENESVSKGAGDPWGLLQDGQYEEAGKIWAGRIRSEGVQYSILLELDCLVESVQDAIRQFDDTSGLFILNRRRGGRNCYLVMWGRFQDEATANAAFGTLPAYFQQQAHKPKVILLAPYL